VPPSVGFTGRAPEKHWPELSRRLGAAYQESYYEAARRSLEGTANQMAVAGSTRTRRRACVRARRRR